MEESDEPNATSKCNNKTGSFKARINPHHHHHHVHHQYQHHQLWQYSNQYAFCNQNQFQRCYPVILPLPLPLPLPPPIPLQLALAPALPPNRTTRPKTHLQKPSCRLNNPPLAATSDTHVPILKISPGKALRKPLLFFYLFFFLFSLIRDFFLVSAFTQFLKWVDCNHSDIFSSSFVL